MTTTTARTGMPKGAILLLLTGTAAIALAGAGASIAQAQAPAGGTAVYWMTADTVSGMGAMGAGGGGGAAAAMRAMMSGGGAPSYAHNLQLQLGTGRKPTGEASAEHLPPSGLQAGPSLPLVTPRGNPPARPTEWMGKMERPKGRILIYWGCGDRVRANQPVVIDFATMTSGKMPPAFAAAKPLTPPYSGQYATYGEWPNSRSQTHVPAGGSLVGAHVVRGNYSPEIKFSLAQGQDFLAPVTVSGNEAGPSGSVPLAWRPVAGARAWMVSTMGSAENGDMIMWSSSESQAMPMAYGSFAPGEIDRLVAAKVLLPASATRCTVPAEVARAAQSSVLMTTAFGSEHNFSHPAKPAKAPASWRPEWTVKLLTKSTYTGMLGMDMSEMFGGGAGRASYGEDGSSETDEPVAPKKKKKRNPLGGLGIGGILGD